MQVNAYLMFDGKCEEAIRFYAEVLGGKVAALVTQKEMPEGACAPAGFENMILHARLEVGDQVLMASDCPPGMYTQPQGFSVSLSIADPAEGERIFNAFAEGGSISMPFAQTFFAYRFGMVTDRFGTPWMVNCEKAA